MQRANGDVFALDDNGRFRVPLFHSRGDAMTARSHDRGMLLFKPIVVDDRLLGEIAPVKHRTDVTLWLVKDPVRGMRHGREIERAELALLLTSSA